MPKDQIIMRQLRNLITIAIAILIVYNSTIAQTQKFDVMTFTPPKGWTAGQNGQAKTFTTIDKANGKFCIMMLYPSVTNHGTPSQDFTYVWKTLVQDSFNAGTNPEKETTQVDAFTMIQGGELIDYEGTKALALLTTVSGKGRVISLLSIMNDAKYSPDVQNFLGGMDIDIKETPKPISNQTSVANSSGNASDYEFTVPPNWKAEYKSNETILRGIDGSVVSLGAFIASSGSLENDISRNFFTIFSGWKPVTTNGFSADWAKHEKGKTKQGYDYYQMLKYATKDPAGNTGYNEIILLLVKIGDKVAVISASQPQATSIGAEKALDFILYDLNFKNTTPLTSTIQKDLLGSWSSASGSVGLNYAFYPNGTFSFGGASQFRTSRDVYTDNVTTTSFSTDGSYSIVGNLLTIIHKKTKVVSKWKIRFYYTKYDKDNWKYKRGELPLDSESGGTIVYNKNK